MSGSGKDVLGVVGISRDEVGAGTFPDKGLVVHILLFPQILFPGPSFLTVGGHHLLSPQCGHGQCQEPVALM